MVHLNTTRYSAQNAHSPQTVVRADPVQHTPAAADLTVPAEQSAFDQPQGDRALSLPRPLPPLDAADYSLGWVDTARRRLAIAGTVCTGLALVPLLRFYARPIDATERDAPEMQVPRQPNHAALLTRHTFSPTSAENTEGHRQDLTVRREPTCWTQAEFFRSTDFTLAFGAGFMGMYAHLGVARALVELNLKPAALAGASSGAIMVGMLGTLSLAETQAALMSNSLLDFMDVSLQALRQDGALCSGDAFLRKLQTTVGSESRLEDCRPNSKIAVFEGGRTQIYGEGCLAERIRASAGLPLLFARPGNGGGMEGGWIDEHVHWALEPNRPALISRLSVGEPLGHFEKMLSRPDPLYNVSQDLMHRTLYAKLPATLDLGNFWTKIDFDKPFLQRIVDGAYSAALAFFVSPGGQRLSERED